MLETRSQRPECRDERRGGVRRPVPTPELETTSIGELEAIIRYRHVGMLPYRYVGRADRSVSEMQGFIRIG